MVEGSDVVTDSKLETPRVSRTQEQFEALADYSVQLLLERVKDRSATSADLVAIGRWLKDAGVKVVIGNETPAGQLARSLPTFDEDDKVIQFG